MGFELDSIVAWKSRVSGRPRTYRVVDIRNGKVTLREIGQVGVKAVTVKTDNIGTEANPGRGGYYLPDKK